MYRLNSTDKKVAARQRMERAIVRRVVTDALAAGYVLDVDDGGDELAVWGATTRKAALDALLNTDEDRLILRRLTASGELVDKGWVRFVYGNDGWDVINDYTLNLEAVLTGANALAEQLEERRR